MALVSLGLGAELAAPVQVNKSEKERKKSAAARARTLKPKCWGATCARVSQKTGAVELTPPSMHTF